MALIGTRNKDETGVLLFKGKKYAVGLMWLTTNVEDSRHLAKDRAKKANADFYCLRTGAAMQHGLGWLDRGHRIGQQAAAAKLADVLVGDWHGIFKADNGWWYVKVHSDVIVPDGDILFTSEEDAYNHFLKNQGSRVWAHSYAPLDWDIQGISKELSLDEVLDSVPGATLTHNNWNALFGGAKNKNIAFIVFTGLLFLLISFIFIPIMFNALKPVTVASKPKGSISATTQNKKNNQKQLQLPGELKELPKLEAPDPTSFKAPKPSDYIQACGQAASQIIQPIPGWGFQGFVCEAKNVTVEWKQNKGTLGMVRDTISGLLKNGASMTLDKGTLKVSVPIPALQEIEQKSFLNTPSAVLQLENRFLNAGGLVITPIKPPPPPPPTPYQQKQGIIPKAEPPYLEIKVTSTLSSKILGNYFDLKGLKILRIEWSFTNKSWIFIANMMTDEGIKKAENPPSKKSTNLPNQGQ